MPTVRFVDLPGSIPRFTAGAVPACATDLYPHLPTIAYHCRTVGRATTTCLRVVLLRLPLPEHVGLPDGHVVGYLHAPHYYWIPFHLTMPDVTLCLTTVWFFTPTFSCP